MPAEEDVMRQRLREEARSNFLQRRNKQFLKNDELKVCTVGYYCIGGKFLIIQFYIREILFRNYGFYWINIRHH